MGRAHNGEGGSGVLDYGARALMILFAHGQRTHSDKAAIVTCRRPPRKQSKRYREQARSYRVEAEIIP